MRLRRITIEVFELGGYSLSIDSSNPTDQHRQGFFDPGTGALTMSPGAFEAVSSERQALTDRATLIGRINGLLRRAELAKEEPGSEDHDSCEEEDR